MTLRRGWVPGIGASLRQWGFAAVAGEGDDVEVAFLLVTLEAERHEVDFR